jgi:ADP-ribose pyrophosphatase YjhB (NUDIX family)
LCADALIVRDGRLFMLRLARGPNAGAWDIPGGFCDAGEHPIATIERTVAEETGLVAEVTGYLGAWRGTFPRSASRPEQIHTLALLYHAAVADISTLRPDPVSVREIGWFTPDDLPADLASPDYLGPVLRAWRDAFLAGRIVTPLPDHPRG